jgi:hypothetical protein
VKIEQSIEYQINMNYRGFLNPKAGNEKFYGLVGHSSGAFMFEVLRLRFFISKVQEELLAQYLDQDFTKTICQLPSNMEQLNLLRKHAYFRKDSMAPFMAVCHVLGESLASDTLEIEIKNTCASLLAERLQKARTDLKFHRRHFKIFANLERKLAQWFEDKNA